MLTLTKRLLIIPFCFAASAHAVFINGGPGLENPAATIDFTEVSLPAGTPLNTQYSSYGVTFAGMYYDSVHFGDSKRAFNFQTLGSPTNPFSIFFNVSQTEAGFDFITQGGSITTFQAYLGGNLKDTGIANTGNESFYGFKGVTFDEIRISVTGGNDIEDGPVAGLTNIQFSNAASNAVPDAGSTVALLGMSVAGLGLLRKKMRLA